MLTYGDEFVFFRDATRDVQLACLRIKVDGCYADGEVDMNAIRGCTAGCSLGSDATDGGGA